MSYTVRLIPILLASFIGCSQKRDYNVDLYVCTKFDILQSHHFSIIDRIGYPRSLPGSEVLVKSCDTGNELVKSKTDSAGNCQFSLKNFVGKENEILLEIKHDDYQPLSFQIRLGTYNEKKFMVVLKSNDTSSSKPKP